MLDHFIDDQLGKPSEEWLPLRQRQSILSTAELPAIKDPRGSPALSRVFVRRLGPPLETPTPSFARSNNKPRVELANAGSLSFEGVLRLHYRHSSAEELSSMVAYAAPVYEESKQKHRILHELGLAHPLPRVAAKPPVWQSIGRTTKPLISPGPAGWGCALPARLPPAGKPASWRSAAERACAVVG